MINQCRNLAFILTGIILVQSCLSTAKLSDLSQSAKTMDFAKIAAAKNTETDKGWNSKTGFEYYIKAGAAEDSTVMRAILDAMRIEGYEVKFLSGDAATILGQRGLRANEWKSVAGIYYQNSNGACEIYIRCKISQDATGGWREDRAKQLGTILCRLLKGCEESYSVNTSLTR